MISVSDAPRPADHDAVDRQAITAEHDGIQQRLILVPCQHRIVVVQSKKIGRRALNDARPLAAACLQTASECAQEQLATDVTVVERRYVTRLH